jgi:hypothetical protein
MKKGSFTDIGESVASESVSVHSKCETVRPAPNKNRRRRLLIVAPHVVQYSSPLFHEMACDPRWICWPPTATCEELRRRSTQATESTFPGTRRC